MADLTLTGGAPTPTPPGSRPPPSSHTVAMLLVGLAAVALACALYAFWSRGPRSTRVVEPTASATPADPRVVQGRLIAVRFGCVACHSSDGTREAGPTWLALSGSQVQLDTGQTVTADDAYLTEKIRHPERTTVAGFPRGLMAPNIQSFQDQLAQPETMAALLAYIDSLR